MTFVCGTSEEKEIWTDIRAIDASIREDIPQVRVADNVRCTTVKEGDAQRIQVFQGDVIRMSGAGARDLSPSAKTSLALVSTYVPAALAPTPSSRLFVTAVFVAKLYYLRDKVARAARIPEKPSTTVSRLLIACWISLRAVLLMIGSPILI